MRALLVLVTLATAPAMAQDGGVKDFSDAMARVSTGHFVPLQMPDGSQLWRWVGKELKGPDLDLRYTDMLAQTMASRMWCPNGWEETKRSTPTKGLLLIEGKCK